MGNLTENLSRHEFACECGCGFDAVDTELVDVLQDCVDHFSDLYHTSASIKITGPNRCKKHNAEIGGATHSQHIYARAADFKVFIRLGMKQVDPDEVAEYLEEKYSDQFGIGRYTNRTHLDTRTNGPARWDAR